MQYFDNGDYFTVTVPRYEVKEFADKWPCSYLRFNPVTFTFSKRNGDLVDSNDAKNHPDADESAIFALACDACEYGMRRWNAIQATYLLVEENK